MIAAGPAAALEDQLPDGLQSGPATGKHPEPLDWSPCLPKKSSTFSWPRERRAENLHLCVQILGLPIYRKSEDLDTSTTHPTTYRRWRAFDQNRGPAAAVSGKIDAIS